jgi:serine/threonine-protein kinase PknK
MEAAAGEITHPPLFRRHARRPRLTQLLDESTAQTILVTAPAGYGKTTLAMEWLQGRDDVVWYRATNASADVAAFSAGLADTVAQLVPGAGERLKQRLRVADIPERAARPLAELLAEDLAAWPEGALLIIDDYHLVADSQPVEDFFDWLLTLAPPQLRVLVTTRRRPRWASARRILYGEITEIGRDQLAMNAEEAGRVLGVRSDEAVRTLVLQAEGWPALIGLAALTASHEIPDERVSEALYRYFAEEVIRRESPEAERLMLLASVPLAIDARAAREVLHVEDAEPLLDGLVTDGLLQPSGSQFRFHPLLRAFLRHKLESEEPEVHAELTVRAIEDARANERWEEAFELAMSSGRMDSALEVVEAASSELLASGRIETLERWIEECGEAAFEFPGTVIAKADVLTRRGRFSEASALADDVIKRLPQGHRLMARGENVAGLSRYLRSESDLARQHYERANELAAYPEDKKDALWGAFVSTVDSDVSAARPYLDELEAIQGEDLNIRLRVTTGRQVLATHSGTHEGIWDLVEPMIPVARYATDPVVRSNFLAQSAYLALTRTHYQVAIPLADQALQVSEELRHEFAIASCLAYRAAAEIGCRQLRRARRDMRAMAEIRATEEDPYLQTELALLYLRLALGEGNLAQARILAEEVPSGVPDRATQGERLGMCAIVFAAVGEANKARGAVKQARAITGAVEAKCYALFAEVIAALEGGEQNEALTAEVARALRECHKAEYLDAFVLAYRAFPPLMTLAADEHDLSGLIEGVIKRARDQRLASQLGFHMATRPSRSTEALLTPREGEVLTLIGQGLSNGEIATRLVITESTAKVHVHNILAKLRVKTRLQAALIAQQDLDEPP